MPKAKKAPTSVPAQNEPYKRTSGNASKKAATKEPTGKASSEQPPVKVCQAGNYLLLVHLSDIYEPGISRVLSVPPETTFDTLHEALQIAFGWGNAHMHQFRIEGHESLKRIPGKALLYLEADSEYIGFHEEIDAKTKEESKFSLADILEDKEYNGRTTLTYEYDMGDGWEHEISVLGRADSHLGDALGVNEFNQKILCISGEGHGCAEDCGGPPGWENLKDTFKKARGGDKDLKDWYKNMCLNGDKKGLDPYTSGASWISIISSLM